MLRGKPPQPARQFPVKARQRAAVFGHLSAEFRKWVARVTGRHLHVLVSLSRITIGERGKVYAHAAMVIRRRTGDEPLEIQRIENGHGLRIGGCRP